jgi:hypothetical protein
MIQDGEKMVMKLELARLENENEKLRRALSQLYRAMNSGDPDMILIAYEEAERALIRK